LLKRSYALNVLTNAADCVQDEIEHLNNIINAKIVNVKWHDGKTVFEKNRIMVHYEGSKGVSKILI